MDLPNPSILIRPRRPIAGAAPVTCPGCGTACYKSHIEPEVLPPGVEAMCARCALAKTGSPKVHWFHQ